MSKPKTYTFTSANKGDIDITIVGEYTNRCVDVVVDIVEFAKQKDFIEIDAGCVDEIPIGLLTRA